jgi:tetratricopeptide (TPR) repeat protein
MATVQEVSNSKSTLEVEAQSPVPLRLTASRGQLGLELYEPLTLAPLQVTSLIIALPNLRYPLDLSGGVHVFRHRRGLLQQMQLRMSYRDLLRRVELTWREFAEEGELGQSRIWLGKEAIHVGLASRGGALAFDLLWAPDEDAARIIVDNARGAGDVGVPLARALQVMQGVLGPVATRAGRVFTIDKLAEQLSRFVFPLIGARAPAVKQGRVSPLRADAEGVACTIDATLPQPAPSERVLRCVGLAGLARSGDDALAQGDLEGARECYLLALEQAPRHPQLAQSIAEIDVAVGGRNEAALSLLKENVPLRLAGATAAQLLAPIEPLLAREVLEHALSREPYATLAACWVERLAQLETAPRAKLDALDRAVALAPGSSRLRKARIAARIELGDVNAVLADAQHLEVAAKGAQRRHQVLCEVARLLLARGWDKDAGRIFERALRYLPDDPDATAGLARAFMASGQPRRAIALFERAVALDRKLGRLSPDAVLDLAQVVASELSDLPHAVARVRQVPFDSPRALEARALEAQWLAELGDITGASQAYGRLRQALELREGDATQGVEPQRAVQWLMQAAQFERSQHDLGAVERHLAVALRLLPRDSQVQVEYRHAAAELASARRAEREGTR